MSHIVQPSLSVGFRQSWSNAQQCTVAESRGQYRTLWELMQRSDHWERSSSRHLKHFLRTLAQEDVWGFSIAKDAAAMRLRACGASCGFHAGLLSTRLPWRSSSIYYSLLLSGWTSCCCRAAMCLYQRRAWTCRGSGGLPRRIKALWSAWEGLNPAR